MGAVLWVRSISYVLICFYQIKPDMQSMHLCIMLVRCDIAGCAHFSTMCMPKPAEMFISICTFLFTYVFYFYFHVHHAEAGLDSICAHI
jgi:hypothetical protein